MMRLLKREHGLLTIMTALIAGTVVIIIVMVLLTLAQGSQKVTALTRNYDQAQITAEAGLNAAIYCLENSSCVDDVSDGDADTTTLIGPGDHAELVKTNSCYVTRITDGSAAGTKNVHIVGITPIATNSGDNLSAVCPWDAGGTSRQATAKLVAVLDENYGIKQSYIPDDDEQISASQTYTQAVLADNPTAYWRFEETATATPAVNQISGAGNGTYTNVAANMNLAGALSDNTFGVRGSGNHSILIPDNNSIDLGNTFTIETWIRRTQTSSNNTTILHKFNAYRLRLQEDDAGSNPTRLQLMLNATDYTCSAAPTSINGNWYHVAFVLSSGTLTCYVNGVKYNTFTAVTPSVNTSAMRVGCQTSNAAGACVSSPNTYWLGNIDELAIYQTALTEGQIKNHYKLR